MKSLMKLILPGILLVTFSLYSFAQNRPTKIAESKSELTLTNLKNAFISLKKKPIKSFGKKPEEILSISIINDIKNFGISSRFNGNYLEFTDKDADELTHLGASPELINFIFEKLAEKLFTVVDDYFEEADSSDNQERMLLAMPLNEKALRYVANTSLNLSAKGHINKGIYYYKLENYDDAIAEVSKVINQLGEKKAAYYVLLGRCYYMKKDYNRALEVFKDAAFSDPTFSLTYLNRGLVYKALKDYKRAIVDFEKVIKSRPDYAGTYNNLGILYYEQDEYDLALKNFDKALELKPDYLKSLANRALVYIEQGLYEQAIDDLLHAKQSKPKDVIVLSNLGMAYGLKENYEKALPLLNESISLNPKFVNAYINLGTVYALNEKYEQAVSNCKTAISLDRNFAESYGCLGQVYDMQGNRKLALDNYDIAIRLNSKLAIVYNNRGLIYLSEEMFDEAISDFKTVIILKPKYAKAYYNLGQANSKVKNYPDAILNYETAVSLKPDYKDALFQLGITHILLGIKDSLNNKELEKSIEYFDKVERLDPNDSLNLETRAGVYFNLHNYERAFNDFIKALRAGHNLDSANSYATLGILYYYRGEYNQAIENYKIAISIKPNEAPIYNNLGTVYLNIGEVDKAIDSYEKAIKFNPDYSLAFFGLGNAYLSKGIDYSNKGNKNEATESFLTAINKLTKAINLNENWADAYKVRSIAFEKLGETKKADEDSQHYEKLIEIKKP